MDSISAQCNWSCVRSDWSVGLKVNVVAGTQSELEASPV